MDVNEPSECSSTPLLSALSRPDLLQILIDNGADITVENPCGLECPLIWEAELCVARSQTCGFLLLPLWRRSLEVLIRAGIELDLPTIVYHMSPLLLTARRRNNAMLDLLLGLGARVDAAGSHSKNILDIAVLYGNREQIESRDY